MLKSLVRKAIRRLLWQTIEDVGQWILDRDAKDIWREMRRQALSETARYVAANMRGVPAFDDRWKLMDHAVKNIATEGCFMEFGVWKGQSINYLAGKTKVPVYGFDSFEGLPEDWVLGYDRERFRVDGLPSVPNHVTLVKGWYDDTVPAFASENDTKLAFAHIDCDLYSSTMTIFDHLGTRFVAGSVIVFDEYFNYPGWREDGEFKAFQEFIGTIDLDYEYLGYTRCAPCVAVRIVDPNAATAGASQ
jgi:hypothetical protein